MKNTMLKIKAFVDGVERDVTITNDTMYEIWKKKWILDSIRSTITDLAIDEPQNDPEEADDDDMAYAQYLKKKNADGRMPNLEALEEFAFDYIMDSDNVWEEVANQIMNCIYIDKTDFLQNGQ